jgi:hypothetical protein
VIPTEPNFEWWTSENESGSPGCFTTLTTATGTYWCAAFCKR